MKNVGWGVFVFLEKERGYEWKVEKISYLYTEAVKL